MKELSVEEKAKRFNEALKAAVVAHKDEDKHLKATLERIFPELKESEDEKIMACIGMCLTDIDEQRFADFNTNLKECSDWLEKQGEQKPILDVEIPFGANDSELIEATYFIPKGFHAEIIGDEVHIKRGEQKPQGKTALEALNEEKADNADKVEPKFKVEKDKWYVCTSQYCNCIEGRNYKASLDGRIIDDYGTEYDIHSDAYRWFRPWTIQDAKDGDVLSWDDSKCITIFKNIYDKDSFNSYGFVGSCTGTFESRIAYHDIKGAHPATREQRDLLFTKMEEAGYEWDARKKELNKVEQKEAIHKELTEFEKAVKQVMEEAIECGDTRNLKADAEMLLSLVHNSAWSEKDKAVLDALIRRLEGDNIYVSPHLAAECLKSLRDRVQSQNTWKPSDKQMNTLEHYMHTLVCNEHKEILFGLYSDLKKLREE